MLTSEWLVLNRPSVAGFHSPGDNNDQRERGEQTIKICNLPRQPLADARTEAQENGFMRYLNHALLGQHRQVLDQYRSGAKPYSAAVLDYIQFKTQELAKETNGS